MRFLNRYAIAVITAIGIMPASAIAGTGSESHSGQAVFHATQASGQAAQSTGQAAMSGAGVVSGVAAVPLNASGAVGASAAKAGNASTRAAKGNQPLKISDEVVTAGPSPDKMLGDDGK